MNMLRNIFCIILFSWTGYAYAETVEYDVEVIIFEDVNHTFNNSERWPVIEDNAEIKAEDVKSTTIQKIQFLTEDASKLQDIIKRLSESNDYKILIHKIWRQPGADKTQAIAVHLNSADDNQGTNNNLSSYIDGDLTLVMSRYLHILGALKYHIKNNETNTYDTYSFDIKRKMRSKEIHYIDHPLLGMIILATPRQ